MMIDPASTLSNLPTTVKQSLHRKYQSISANRKHEPPNQEFDRQDKAPNHILVILIDALRPDFIPEIPLDFTHAIAPAPWTFPSVTSLHTGLRPSDHGSVAHTHPDDEDYAMPAQTESYPHFPLDLEAAGYETYAGCAFATPFLALRGWYQTHRYYTDSPASSVISDYRSWRRDRNSTAAYLHLGDLHAPVSPPKEYVERHNVDTSLPELGHILQYKTDFDETNPDHTYYRKQKIRLHQAALAYVSDQLRSLVEDIQDDTFLIIAGDHGEALWEYQELDREITDSRPNYCFGHGGTPFDKIARVPLTVSSPFDTPMPSGGWASLRDVPATILESAINDRSCPGHSWYKEIPASRAVICEGTRYGVERKAVYQSDQKLITSQNDDVTLTAKLDAAGENFIELPETDVDRLLNKLPSKWDNMDTSSEVSGTTKEQLEALGYR